MKKVIITFVFALMVSTFSFAATAKSDTTKVSKFEAGKALTQTDVAFLNVIANGPEKSRGAASTNVTVDNVKYAVGQKLSKADADKLNTKASAVAKASKPADAKVRGAVCYYLYCNGYGQCYYVYYYC
jgi:hypothetical protein